MTNHTPVKTHIRPTGGMRQYVPAGVLGGGAGVLLAATVVSNGGNLVFNVLVSRLLGPERYGALGSVLGFLTVFTVLTTAAQLAVAQAVAGRVRNTEGLSLRKPVLVAATAGLAGLTMTAAFSPLLEGFLHLASPGLVILLGLVLLPTIAAAVPIGVMLGRQRFGIVGASLMAGTIGRILIGVLLVEVGLGTGGALAGSVGGQLLAYLVVLWPIRHELLSRSGAQELSTRVGVATLSVVALSGLSAFTAVDSILVRHYLAPAAAGHYVAAATAARIALFAPGAVALIAFPRFVALSPGDRAERRLLGEALIVTTLLSVGAAVGLMAVPHLVVTLFFGSSYGAAVPILRVLAVAGASLGVIGLLIYYHQARSSMVAACSWLGVAGAVAVISLSAHGSGTQVAWVMVGATVMVLVVALATALWSPAPSNRAASSQRTRNVRFGLSEDPTLDITMVVPYYNPGPRFIPNLQDLASALEDASVSFEVIAVSDGSTDGSITCLGDLAEQQVWLRRVELPTNQGKGEALRAGLSVGRGRYLGFIDSDGDIPAVQVKHLVALVRTFQPDVVLGSKRHPLSEVKYPPLRRTLSWGYQQLVRVLFRLNVRDTQTGLKLVRNEVLAAVLPRMLEKRFAFDLELLVVARRLGYRRFFEAPVTIQERFSSTIRPRSVWPMLVDTFAVFYRLRVLRYYDRRKQQVGQPSDCWSLVSVEVPV